MILVAVESSPCRGTTGYVEWHEILACSGFNRPMTQPRHFLEFITVPLVNESRELVTEMLIA